MTLGSAFRRIYAPPVAEPRSFRDYIAAANPRYQFYRHCEVLIEQLQRVADGDLKRLMVFAPPRSGKSELVSRLFPGYFLERHPEQFFGLTSYAAGLAFTLSRNARDMFERAGNPLSKTAGGVEQWETTSGGGLWAAGVGGPITGKGAHCAGIDDPIKNAQEAASETIREKHKDWYRSTLYTRLEPDAALICTQTRWHEDDLSGWLLALEDSEDDAPEGWTILNLPSIAEKHTLAFPSTCAVLPDWRQPGEALNPARYPVDKLKKIEKKIGSRYFAALHQQRPTAEEGDIFKRAWWQWYTTPERPIPGVRMLPTGMTRVIQSWDLAFKDTETSDFVSGQVWGQRFTDLYLLDRINDRLSFTASCMALETMAGKWPQARGIYVEDKANGPAVINALRRRIHGMVPVKPDGGKIARAYAVQPIVEAGQCFLPHPTIAPWIEDFVRQLAAFPRGVHDDDVDACTQALNVLARSARDERPAEEEENPSTIPNEFYTATAERSRKLPARKHQQRRPVDGSFGIF